MRYCLILFALSLLIISCEPTRKAALFIPPGEKPGKTWGQSADYGYQDTVYAIPSYISYPLKGNRNFRIAIHKAYRSDVCNNEPSRATVQYVVSEKGWIMNVHPITELNEACLSDITSEMKKFQFYPAEHNGKSVKMVMAYTFSRDRL